MAWVESLEGNAANPPRPGLNGGDLQLTTTQRPGRINDRVHFEHPSWKLTVSFDAQALPFDFVLRARDPTTMVVSDQVNTSMLDGATNRLPMRVLMGDAATKPFVLVD
jgi:hypothetical protein